MSSDETALRRAGDLQQQFVLLGISAAILVLAAVLEVRDGESVILPAINIPLPPTCTYRQWVGTNCPGCGLTRCFICMARGEFGAAWSFHPTGMLLFAFVAAQIPYRAVQIYRLRRGLDAYRFGGVAGWMLICLVALMVVQWLLKTFWFS